MKSAVAAFAFFLSVAPVAQAQEPTPESQHGRFTFKQVSDGLLRLDTQTGEVALCSKRAVGWACQALPEDRTALENEIARLQGENAALKRELVARGLPLPNGIKGRPPRSGRRSNSSCRAMPISIAPCRSWSGPGAGWSRWCKTCSGKWKAKKARSSWTKVDPTRRAEPAERPSVKHDESDCKPGSHVGPPP